MSGKKYLSNDNGRLHSVYGSQPSPQSADVYAMAVVSDLVRNQHKICLLLAGC